jgi:acetoin utilization deacetylase AcuC-like enzyme
MEDEGAAERPPASRPGRAGSTAPTVARGLTRPVRCSLRRGWRRVRYLLRPPVLRAVYDPAYERSVWGVPLDPLRADRVLAFLANEGLLLHEEISRPRPVSLRNVLLVHAPEYLESLQSPATITAILGRQVDEGEIETVLDHQLLSAGGTIQATRLALGLGCVAVNLGGGFHHAMADQGMGFCVFNDLAIAIRRLRRRGYRERILVVDLDLHDGNGTRAIFADDETVHTFSIHNADWGPTDAVASTSIALGAEVGDDLYLATLVKALPPIFDAFQPRLVIYLAGCDGAADDAIGNWKLSADAILARDRLVVDLVRRHGARLAIVLGGGYGDHAWRYTARMLSWQLSGRVVEPPSNEELTLVRFRQIKRRLDPFSLGKDPTAGATSFELSEEDLVGIVPGIPRETRFLGSFSRVGVELLLERLGILEQLRARGFRRPVTEVDLEHPIGHALRIWDETERRELLVEVRLARNNRAVQGCEMLSVEWLLLQNPRGRFSPDHPPLPGQRHPGLGMLGEFFGWLVVLCETLELDGLVFTASHYHIAAIARRFVRLLEPTDEALLRSLQAVLAGLPLDLASRWVDEGRIVDRQSGRSVRFEGVPLVVPVSDRLRARVSGEPYEAEVERRLATLRLEIGAPALTT